MEMKLPPPPLIFFFIFAEKSKCWLNAKNYRALKLNIFEEKKNLRLLFKSPLRKREGGTERDLKIKNKRERRICLGCEIANPLPHSGVFKFFHILFHLGVQNLWLCVGNFLAERCMELATDKFNCFSERRNENIIITGGEKWITIDLLQTMNHQLPTKSTD